MVFLPFFSAEPEKEGRGFKLRPCVSLLSLAVERWETPAHPVTPSYMLICSPQRDQRRNMAKLQLVGRFSRVLKPGLCTGKSRRYSVWDPSSPRFSTQAGTSPCNVWAHQPTKFCSSLSVSRERGAERSV